MVSRFRVRLEGDDALEIMERAVGAEVVIADGFAGAGNGQRPLARRSEVAVDRSRQGRCRRQRGRRPRGSFVRRDSIQSRRLPAPPSRSRNPDRCRRCSAASATPAAGSAVELLRIGRHGGPGECNGNDVDAVVARRRNQDRRNAAVEDPTAATHDVRTGPCGLHAMPSRGPRLLTSASKRPVSMPAAASCGSGLVAGGGSMRREVVTQTEVDREVGAQPPVVLDEERKLQQVRAGLRSARAGAREVLLIRLVGPIGAATRERREALEQCTSR